MKALSIRQPWAWLVVNGHKDVENRDWPTNYRGRLVIHTGAKVDEDAVDAYQLAESLGITIPPLSSLPRGGIVGMVELVDTVRESSSPWFTGPVGFALDIPVEWPLSPMPGSLYLFDVDKCLRCGQWRRVLKDDGGCPCGKGDQ